MIKIQCFVLCLLGFFIAELNSSAVSFIKPCYADDEACLLHSAQAAVPHVAHGIPELKIPSADPLFIKSVNDNDKDFKLEFSNIHIAGVSKAKILELSRDTKENTIKMVVESPLKANGQYELDGKIFIIHAFGEGDFEIKTDKVVVDLLMRVKDIEKDGKKYWKIVGYNYNFDLVSKVFITMDNLFGGDKKKAEPFVHLLDVSWKEVVTEVGDKLLGDVIGAYVDVIKKFLVSIPSEQLELKRH